MNSSRVLAFVVAAGIFLVLPSTATTKGSSSASTKGSSSASTQESETAGFPDVVARVNGTEISKQELMRRGESLRAQVPPSEQGPDFYQRVLDDIITGELLFQSVETRGMIPADEEVEVEYGEQIERFGGTAAFEKAISDEGVTVEEIRAEIRREMAIRNLVENELASKVAVTEEDKRTFYEGNAESMQQPAEFLASHILISVEADATPEVKAEREKKATSILGMIELGQDFGELAARNSGDPGSKDNGGELPWMSEGQTVAPFEAAMKALQPGEMSGVVETQFGYHIIKLLDRRGGDQVPYEEVHERIEEFLMRRGLQQQIQREVETLKGQASIERFI